ncbi:MAG: TonB-dependent receptor [Bacteroidetes bacterium]|nr:TonB-dependent receptor [Bacteroidota bacterium]
MKKIYLALVLVVFGGLTAFAQNDNGAIRITLQDKTTKEEIPFANVVAYKDGVQVGVATTDIDGVAIIKPLAPGKYTVKGVYVGYQAAEIKDVLVGEGKTAYVTIPLSNGEGVRLDEVEVIVYQIPLIDPDMKSGSTVDREQFQNMAVKDVNSVAAQTAGVYQADEGKGLNVRGGREGATTYFVDGAKVFGTPKLPQQGIEQINMITGGVPASYGDLTSGAISITTRGPQSQYFGGVELISSQLTDKFGYNSLGFSVGGPLYKKKDSTKRTVLGFFISGQGNYIKEPTPSFVPIYVIKDEKLDELQATPLLPSPSGTGYIRATDFITKNDMNTQAFRPNTRSRALSLNAKLDFAPTANTNISLGGFYDYTDNKYGQSFTASGGPIAGNLLLNSNNNPLNTQRMWRGTLSITQKFGTSNSGGKSQSIVTNPFFKFLASYEDIKNLSGSEKFKDRVFEYGYIGNFDRTFHQQEYAWNYAYAPGFEIPGQPGTAVNAYTYTGRSEMPVKFTAGDLNPEAVNYTRYLVEQTPAERLSMDYIVANNGLRNGDSPQSIYSLFSSFGSMPGVYLTQNRQQARVAASFNADIKNHAITVGMEFDQRFTSNYQVGGAGGFAPSAQGLWTRMRQITNSHTDQLDMSNPHLNADLSGLIPYYYYDYAYNAEKQTQFSERLLEKLGLPKNYTGFVNTDALNPADLSLDMFSAEDLLGGSSETNLVAYMGYSHDGKRNTDKTNISDFLTKKDENGRNMLPIGTFKPIYTSVYIMDKFDFKDIKFNVGLRVDRFDANQPVLKDKYALHDLARVGDLSSLSNLPTGFADNVPQNISKDAAVYVAQNPSGGKSPVSIMGYRDGDVWFDAEGKEISDPRIIASADGRPIPLYKDNANYDKNMSVDAFTNYVAAINAMPRLAFSFPISDVANFFAHYDILTKRPGGNVLNPLDYYYLSSSANTPFLANPNLKPESTVDYELGFSQVLNERKNASLTITSFYREFRNQLNQRMIVGAYPKNYLMYDNIDFGTVKGLSLVFDFRRTGGSRINFNYTLQFAEGSGSNANSGANLASSGQPNLRVLQPLDYDQRHSFVLTYDYRFGGSEDYRGPAFKTKNDKTIRILEDVGFNLSFLVGSGTPYTRWIGAVPTQGGNGRSSILGQINGSSKPWQFRTNFRIDKNVPLTFGKDDKENKKTANLNIYLQVLNLLNSRNILNVYNYTGMANDDGFLSSQQGQVSLSQANSPLAYSDMYSIRVNNPNNYSLPRQIRIGLLFEF